MPDGGDVRPSAYPVPGTSHAPPGSNPRKRSPARFPDGKLRCGEARCLTRTATGGTGGPGCLHAPSPEGPCSSLPRHLLSTQARGWAEASPSSKQLVSQESPVSRVCNPIPQPALTPELALLRLPPGPEDSRQEQSRKPHVQSRRPRGRLRSRDLTPSALCSPSKSRPQGGCG